MKLSIAAVTLLLVALVTGHEVPCSVDATLASIVAGYCDALELKCVSQTDQSPYASCPEGYTATGCACGMGCGSWDIHSPNICHCQCNDVDWTAARCCRIKPQ